MNWLKRKLNAAWLKIKSWWLVVLIALGFSVGIPAAPYLFDWTNPTQRTDGTTYDPATEQAEIRLYCDGDVSPTFISPGFGESFTGDLNFGNHTCFATSVDNFGQESDPSNSISFVVTPARPNPPVLN